MKNHKTIAFIGAGKITGSIVGGLLQQGYQPDHIWCTNPTTAKLTTFAAQSVHTTTDNITAAQAADIIVLAVKPAVVLSVCAQIGAAIQASSKLVISVVTGITTGAIAAAVGRQPAIVRAMPNTPVQVGAGMTGLYANLQVSELQREIAESLFRTVGSTQWLLHEQDLDLLTAVSGSGPGYVYYFMEALERVATQAGFSASVAHLLVTQTVLGAAKLAMESGVEFAALRQQSTSPHGTTAAAIEVLEQGGMANVLHNAVHAAHRRAQELAALGDKKSP